MGRACAASTLGDIFPDFPSLRRPGRVASGGAGIRRYEWELHFSQRRVGLIDPILRFGQISASCKTLMKSQS